MDLPDESVEDYLAVHCGDDGFDCDLLRAIAGANRTWGTPTGASIVETHRALAGAGRRRARRRAARSAHIVFTGKGTPRRSRPGQIKAEPDYERARRAARRCCPELLRVQRGARLAADMAAGLRAGQAFAAAYTRAKRAAGVADFNDLIDWTRRLLAMPGMGEWVRYKLDRQVDHVLVDEAQDTNAAQWEIIGRAGRGIFSGSSEAERRAPHLVHGRRLQAGDLRLPGHRPKRFGEARESSEARARSRG